MIESNILAKLKRPSKVAYEFNKSDSNIGVFIAKPFERGAAMTVGNAFRRVLLSSLDGYAIVAVRFDNINNEFDNIKAVYEDTIEICANLKKVVIGFKNNVLEHKILHFDIKGKKQFYAKDLVVDNDIEVGNPEHLIFSSSDEANFSFDLQISKGNGYIPSEEIQKFIETIGIIPLDADFSPIKKVSYKVSNIRYSGRNDYDKLELIVETKGLGSPENFVKDASFLLREYFLTFDELEEQQSSFTEAVGIESDETVLVASDDFDQSVYDLDFSIKTLYFLRKNNLSKKGDLMSKTEEELKKMEIMTDDILTDIRVKSLKKDF